MGIRVLEEHVSSLARGRTYNGGLVLFHCRGMSFFAPIFQLSLLSSWWGYWDILDETGNVLVSAGRRTAHSGWWPDWASERNSTKIRFLIFWLVKWKPREAVIPSDTCPMALTISIWKENWMQLQVISKSCFVTGNWNVSSRKHPNKSAVPFPKLSFLDSACCLLQSPL